MDIGDIKGVYGVKGPISTPNANERSRISKCKYGANKFKVF